MCFPFLPSSSGGPLDQLCLHLWPVEEDWEKELREELGEEYEVVGGGGTGGKDSEQWEEEIQNMIDEEDADLR